MPVVGILTEKPSAARHLAAALGGPTGHFGGTDYVITHARGHLYEFVDPHRMVSETLVDAYKAWSLAKLPWNPEDFTWELEPIADTGPVAAEIKRTLARCDEIVIATDVDH